MGVGIGGDYPLSAVISSEFASIHTRGRMMTAVFASQGWGNLASALVSLTVVAAFKHRILFDVTTDGAPNFERPIDFCWRILIGLGCVPAVLALYFRLTIPETPRFTMDIERNVRQAAQDVERMLADRDFTIFAIDPDAVIQRVEAPQASRRDFASYFFNWDNGKVLLGASYSWFALDVALYATAQNPNLVYQAIGFGPSLVGSANTTVDGSVVYRTLNRLSLWNIIVAVGGYIPGYYCAFLLIDSWGRKRLQIMGFIALTILYCVIGEFHQALF